MFVPLKNYIEYKNNNKHSADIEYKTKTNTQLILNIKTIKNTQLILNIILSLGKIYWIVTTRLKFGWFYIKESSICSHNKVNVGTCISCFIILKGSIVNLKFHAKNIDSSSFISRQISFEYWIPYTKYLIRIWILEKDCTTNFACSPSKTTIINL